MSDTQYKVSVVAKVTSKCFIGLVLCVVQLTACLIHFSLVYMNIELVRQVGSTVLLLCSLVSTLGLTTVKQLSVGKQSSLNVATRFRRRQTKQFTRTRRHCPLPHSRVQPPVSHQSNVQGEQQTSTYLVFLLFCLVLCFCCLFSGEPCQQSTSSCFRVNLSH